MSTWVLLALAGSTYMGSYTTEAACHRAIREALAAQAISVPMQRSDPALRKLALELADANIGIQKDFVCVSKQ